MAMQQMRTPWVILASTSLDELGPFAGMQRRLLDGALVRA